jgi:hypothetical protein
MATRAPPSLHDLFINRPLPTQSDVAYANTLENRDPAIARQARNVGRDVGLPGPTIEADLDGFKQEAANNRNLDLLGNDPSLARFLVDPHNAAAVKDDLPSLAEMSAMFKLADEPGGDPSGRSFINYMKNTTSARRPGRLLDAFMVSSPKQDYSFNAFRRPVADDVFDRATNKFKVPVPSTPLSGWDIAEGIDATITSTIANTGRGAEEFLADAIGLGDQYRNTSYAQDVAQTIRKDQDIANRPAQEIDSYLGRQAYSATQSLAIMGASVMSDDPILAMGVLAGAPQYAAVRDRGGTRNEALASATLTGASESLFEKYFGLGWMLGNFGKKATSKFVGGLLLREVPSEVATTAVQDFADAMVTGGGGWETYKKNLPQDLLDTAASTALMVGMVGGLHHIANVVSPERRAVDDIERAGAGANFLEGLMAAAEKSKVKKEDPETLRDFIDQRTQDSPVRNIYLPVEAAATYMQSENYKGELDRYKDQIAQAQATQGDVVIPIGDAVAHLAGTPAWEAIKEDVRIDPGGLSRKEAVEKHAEIIQSLEQRGKEIAVEAQSADESRSAASEVYVDVKNRLRIAGIEDRQADAVAQIYAARYEARAARRGGTPMEQFKASNIVFPGEKVGQFEGREVAQGPGAIVNIGLNVFPELGGGTVHPAEAIRALKAQGVDVTETQVRQSGTEPTLVARLSKPLTPEQGHAVSSVLRQEAIAQRTGNKGDLFGPAAEKWAPFNSDYFLDFDRSLNQSATIGGYEGLVPFLTDEEKERLRDDSKRKILSIAENLPDAEEMAAVAHAGRAKRGWYENSAQAILDVFGPADAPRFAALLAALSPQTSVESNLYNALKTWTSWNEAGRPTERKAIVQVMGKSVQGGKGIGSILTSWINNAVTALTAENPAQIKLSGPKVDSFMNNLMGVVDEVTNDTWMANYAAVDPVLFKKTGQNKGPGYKAMAAVTRVAADILTRRTGELWTPAEVQETVWSLAKTLYEMRDQAGENRTMRELLEAGHVTHDDIANTPDFGVLFADGIYRSLLEEAGYGEKTQTLGRNRRAVGVDGQESVAAEPAAGFSQDAYRAFLAQAADRLESVRTRRLTESAVRRGDPRQRELFQDVMPEAGWTPERVSGLIDQYGLEDGSSAAIAVMMSPDEYLGLMASAEGRKIIEQRVTQLDEYGPLDPERLRASPPIILRVALGGENDTRPPPMVRGHDGRHRMMMLKQAGIARAPVVVQLTDKDGKPVAVKEPTDIHNILANRSRADQLSNGDLTGSIERGLPISFKYADQIADMGERVLHQTPQAPFYSALERAIASSPQAKASAEQWAATLRKTPGVKQEELEWSGLLDFLAMNAGPITREQLSELLAEGGVQTEEVVLGDVDPNARQAYDVEPRDRGGELTFDVYYTTVQGERRLLERGFATQEAALDAVDNVARTNTQFQSWTSDPSNPTYHELLITLPQGVRGNPARAPSTHWDVEGVVAHARFMDKTDADGKRVLFVEEVQSDWHQKGRDQGYSQGTTPERLRELQDKFDKADLKADRAMERMYAEADRLITLLKASATEATRETADQMAADWTADFDAPQLWKRQAARIKVVRELINISPKFKGNDALIDEMNQAFLDRNEAKQALDNAKQDTGIPEAPFKASWPALVMKRMIRWASDNGYDKVAWTTGEEQASRYNLAQHTGAIVVIKDDRDGGQDYVVKLANPDANITLRQQVGGTYVSGGGVKMTAEQITQQFGNDLGQRMILGADTAPVASRATSRRRRGHESLLRPQPRQHHQRYNQEVRGEGRAG